MDFPTEEEFAEFQEMFQGGVLPSQIDPPKSQPVSTVKNTPTSNRSESSFFQNNTQLSDIDGNDTSVNRRLFGTPINTAIGRRVASTPFVGNLASTPHHMPYDDDDDVENNHIVIDCNPRKRRLDDLFGNIDDIVREENLAQVFYPEDAEAQLKKRARNEEEQDRELIERILVARAENLARNNNFVKQSKLQQLEALRKFKERNISELYPQWPCIPVMNGDRQRIYVRMHSEEFETKQLNELSIRQKISQVLGESSDDIWNEAQQIVEKRMVAANHPVPMAATNSEMDVIEVNPNAGKLWVDKYRPKTYFDLLSDESTNRRLLTWLKMWDKIVFNRNFQEAKTMTEQEKHAASNFNKRTGKFETGNLRFKKRPNDLKTELDAHGRPVQKVAVLCGPPGLGKTTLAHTIARHAGYAVREINASDDRSPECFRLALQNGTEMQTTLLDQEQRPNCIILDEIDGAPIASIEFLIKFINDQTKDAKKGKATAAAKTIPGEKKPKATGILRRPIICICNDIYTPSLRPLRQHAFIVTFPELDSARLAERLLTISRKERLRTDMTTLLALAEKTSNDIRSCISVLQFFANSRKPLELSDVLRSNIGQKDKQKGLFEIWSAVFQIRRPKQGAEAAASTTNRNKTVAETPTALLDTSLRARIDNVLSVVHLGGDSDRLINGVFENYLSQKMPNSNFFSIAEAVEWFCFSDLLQTQIHTLQNYTVYPYLPYGFAAWHLQFSSITWPKITFPTQGYEYHQKLSTQKSIRTAFIKNMSAVVRSIANTPSILSDAITSIQQIISPSLRSVSLQLLSPRERADLQHTVQVMADLGLTYVQTKNADGTYQYQVEPDISYLFNFKVNQRAGELTYANMQIIAREVELEVMRRATPMQGPLNPVQPKKPAHQKPQNHLQKLATTSINLKNRTKDLVTKDFFGRISEKRIALPVQEGGQDQIVKSPIWYKFKEGFNNAVRKDVTLQNLL